MGLVLLMRLHFCLSLAFERVRREKSHRLMLTVYNIPGRRVAAGPQRGSILLGGHHSHLADYIGVARRRTDAAAGCRSREEAVDCADSSRHPAAAVLRTGGRCSKTCPTTTLGYLC